LWLICCCDLTVLPFSRVKNGTKRRFMLALGFSEQIGAASRASDDAPARPGLPGEQLL
jgi:hypothetical protein